MKVAAAEIPNETSRLMLSYPSSEQASATVRQKGLSEQSVSQVDPGFRNEFDDGINRRPWLGADDDIKRKSDPIVYGSQGY